MDSLACNSITGTREHSTTPVANYNADREAVTHQIAHGPS
jgi:hypothetical protein